MENKAKRASDKIEAVKIEDILIKDRVRVDMKDLEQLALSLNIEGQLQPIVVDLGPGSKFILVDGERRIRAAQLNGWKKIDAIKLQSLTEVRRKELELIQCIQREQLDFIEEAMGVKRLVELRKAEAQKGSLGRPSRAIKNKEIAVELNISESRMSENLKIAEAVETNPELESLGLKRTEFLKKIRKRDFFVPRGGVMQSIYEESFTLDSPLKLLDSIGGRIIDLCILDPDKVDIDLLKAVKEKMNPTGQIILFTNHKNLRPWEAALQENGFKIGTQPYIWHIKGPQSSYENFIWAGVNRAQPLRVIPQVIDASRPFKAVHQKAKPYALMSQIIKSCTERGDFVVIPECYDIDTVRCCVEINRNVRAGQENMILRDRLVLSVVR